MIEGAVSNARATVRFLDRKVEECEALRHEVAALKRQMQDKAWRLQRTGPIHSPEQTD